MPPSISIANSPPRDCRWLATYGRLVVADAVAPEFPEVVVMPVSRRRFEDGAPYFNTLTGIARNWGRLV
jgi:hypothetical protein